LYSVIFLNTDLARTEGIHIQNSANDWMPHKVRSLNLDPKKKYFPERIMDAYKERVASGNLGPNEKPFLIALVSALIRCYKQKEAEAA